VLAKSSTGVPAHPVPPDHESAREVRDTSDSCTRLAMTLTPRTDTPPDRAGAASARTLIFAVARGRPAKSGPPTQVRVIRLHRSPLPAGNAGTHRVSLRSLEHGISRNRLAFQFLHRSLRPGGSSSGLLTLVAISFRDDNYVTACYGCNRAKSGQPAHAVPHEQALDITTTPACREAVLEFELRGISALSTVLTRVAVPSENPVAVAATHGCQAVPAVKNVMRIAPFG
jgi:hypothetical protein